MEPKRLDQLLEEIRTAIRDVASVDDKGRKILRDLDRDIHSFLERTQKTQSDDPMLQGMKNAIEHFEMSHPALTAMLSEASAILSNAGI